MTQRFDLLLRRGSGAQFAGEGYGIVNDAAIGMVDGSIAWLGHDADLPAGTEAHVELDVAQHWITPGLIDCHTHLVYGGNRANEFEQRLTGVSYADIAKA